MTITNERLDELEQFWSCRLITPWASPDGEPKPPTAQENDYLISAARRLKEAEAERDALKAAADYLWSLLDSIDNLPDMIHPSQDLMVSGYFKNVERRHKLRFNVGETDGYTVTFKAPPEDVEQP